MVATPGTVPGPRPEGFDAAGTAKRGQPFPAPLASPHIVVMDADLDDLERTGRMLSGRGFSITLSSILLDEPTRAFLKPDLLIADLSTVLPGRARRTAERLVLDVVQRERIPVILCRSGLRRGQGTGRPGVAQLAKPLQADDVIPAVEALLYWRTEQQRARSLRVVGPVPGAPMLVNHG